MQANEIDKAKLEELVAAAITAKYVFWDALSDIEQYAGVDLDDLDMEIEHLDADDVLEMLEEQKEEKSTATTTELGEHES